MQNIIKLLLVITLSSSLLFAAGKNSHEKEFYRNGKVRYELIHDKKDKTITTKKLYLPNGKLKAIARYKNGKPDGVSKIYYDNGKTEKITNYKMGVKDGIENSFYENGKLRQTTPYTNGVLEGHVKMYYDTGEVKIDDTVVHDKRLNQKWFYRNGNIYLDINYVDRVPTKAICYNEKGKNAKELNEEEVYDMIVYGNFPECK